MELQVKEYLCNAFITFENLNIFVRACLRWAQYSSYNGRYVYVRVPGIVNLISFHFRCPTFGTIPAECRLIQDQNKPCCQVPYCDFVNPTPFTGGIPTPKPKIPTPRPGVVIVAPYVIPQASTSAPWINPTPAPSNQPSPTPRPEGW